jgi:hypothetical protein
VAVIGEAAEAVPKGPSARWHTRARGSSATVLTRAGQAAGRAPCQPSTAALVRSTTTSSSGNTGLGAGHRR